MHIFEGKTAKMRRRGSFEAVRFSADRQKTIFCEGIMGSANTTLKRYEKKYLLSDEQYCALQKCLEPHVEHDEFFKSTVCTIYYDSDDYALIRSSIEKPVYKEKLRVRSYNTPDIHGKVFVELKKKFKGVVYKRRVRMEAGQAEAYLAGREAPPFENQVIRELDWFLRVNPVTPKVFLACERSAYVAKEDPDLRITFDQNLRWRDTELDLTKGHHGQPLIDPGNVLMEIKIPGTMPVWLATMLSELKIFPASFSKYGTCYKKHILHEYIDGVIDYV